MHKLDLSAITAEEFLKILTQLSAINEYYEKTTFIDYEKVLSDYVHAGYNYYINTFNGGSAKGFLDYVQDIMNSVELHKQTTAILNKHEDLKTINKNLKP